MTGITGFLNLMQRWVSKEGVEKPSICVRLTAKKHGGHKWERE